MHCKVLVADVNLPVEERGWKMEHTTSSVKVSLRNEIFKYPMLKAYLIGTPLRHIENVL